MPNITAISKIANITRNFSSKSGIEFMLGRPITATITKPTNKRTAGFSPHTGNCYICLNCPDENKRRRKTCNSCMNCSLPLCDEHTQTYTKCQNCDN